MKKKKVKSHTLEQLLTKTPLRKKYFTKKEIKHISEEVTILVEELIQEGEG
jgi:hypothetical protein